MNNESNSTQLTKFGIAKMDNTANGLLKIHIRRGINLAVRDIRSSDPYIIVRMGKQKLKTKAVKKNLNPEWNEYLTLFITDPNLPVKLQVYDKDLFSFDDKMGDAEFEIKSFIEAVKIRKLGVFKKGNVITKLKPTRQNCLAEESYIRWDNDKIVQSMFLRLKNVESGEVELQLEWVEIPN